MLTPRFSIRARANARRVRLRITLQRGLEVTVPRGFDTARIPALLESERNWIHEAFGRIEARRQLLAARDPWSLPTEIVLPAIGAGWRVNVTASDAPWVRVCELDSRQLRISGAISEETLCRKALSRWLMRKAQLLVPALNSESLHTGLRYQRVIIRRQRTRWASCSSRGTISLSANLLFLPPRFVRYVLLHELCHLREMNHSKRFWQLLARHCPGYEEVDSQLRRMRESIPRWAERPG